MNQTVKTGATITKKDILNAYESEENLTCGKDLAVVYVWKQDDFSRLIFQVRIYRCKYGSISLKKDILRKLEQKFQGKPYSSLPRINLKEAL